MLIDYATRILVEDDPGFHYYRVLQTLPPETSVDESILEPGNESLVHRAICIEEELETVPTATASGLVITMNVGSLFKNETANCTAHATLGKSFLITVLRVNATNATELRVREKTTGEYSDIPDGRIVETYENGQLMHIKEFTLVANGTTLVEVL